MTIDSDNSPIDSIDSKDPLLHLIARAASDIDRGTVKLRMATIEHTVNTHSPSSVSGIHLTLESTPPHGGPPQRLVEVLMRANEALIVMEANGAHLGHVIKTASNSSDSVMVFRPA